METSFLTLGIVMLLAVMLPGADFAIVTKNTIQYSRKAGFVTALGIGSAIWVHMTYCILGLAVVIQHSFWIFHAIQYAGAFYLAYLGINLMKSSSPEFAFLDKQNETKRFNKIPYKKIFKQGFFSNLLNPKATLFFLTLFSTITGKNTSFLINLAYAMEMFLIAVLWFFVWAYLLSHHAVSAWLDKFKYIEKILGVLLLSLAVLIFSRGIYDAYLIYF